MGTTNGSVSGNVIAHTLTGMHSATSSAAARYERRAFICECADPKCREKVMLTNREYEELSFLGRVVSLVHGEFDGRRGRMIVVAQRYGAQVQVQPKAPPRIRAW